jgi:hypothetical protein
MSDEPLPLVTATFTTDELAKMSAGLHLLRKYWVAKSIQVAHRSDERAHALETVEATNDLFNRIGGLITKDQGDALLKGLINDKLRRSDGI